MRNFYQEREFRFGQVEATKGLFLYALNLVCGGWLAVLATVLWVRHTTYPWATLRSPGLLAWTGAFAAASAVRPKAFGAACWHKPARPAA
jgi:hypothetical protein